MTGPDARALPAAWTWARVGDLAEYINGLAFKRTDREQTGRQIVRIQNLTDPAAEFNRTTRAVDARHVVNQGDILVSWSATLDAFRWTGAASLLNQHIFRVVPNEAIVDKDLLFWGLKRVLRELRASGHTHGSTLRHINRGPFLAHPFALPPRAEQARIARKLDSLYARTAAARGALTAVPTLLDRLRRSVLSAAFRGQTTADWRARNPDIEPIESTIRRVDVASSSARGRAATARIIHGKYALAVGMPEDMDCPPGWRWLPLGQVSALESGHTPSRERPEYWDGEIPWIGILDARASHGTRIQRTLRTITPAGIANSAARILPAGTVCLSRTASVGYVVITGQAMATSQDFANWVCSSAVVPEFLAYLFQAEGESLPRFGQGTTHTTIYYPEIKAFHVCLPPVAEQLEIVARLDRAMRHLAALRGTWRSLEASVEALDARVLTKAFSGGLVPQDPGDEPAATLLSG